MPRKVLELDGETEFLVRYGADSGILTLDPTTRVPGCVLLSDHRGHCGSMKIEPDPVRAAVQAERERIGDLVLHHFDDGDKRAWLLSAIDAPAEENPSEYQQGAQDIERQVFELIKLRIEQRYLADSYAAQRQALKGFAAFLWREWHMEEPTP